MKQFWGFGLALCLWLGFGLAPDASGSGILLPGYDPPCIDRSQIQQATFTPARFTYVFTGSFPLAITRLNLPTKAPWTGVGTYEPATGQTHEDIIVPAPRIDQPSRPYGRFLVTMHCNADPWLNPYIKCDQISPTVDAPLDRTGPNTMGWKQPYPLAPIITGDIQNQGRPYTAYLCGDTINALNAQYKAYLAQRREELLRGGIAKPPGPAATKFQGGSLALKQSLTPPPPPNPYGATYAAGSLTSLTRGQTKNVQVQVTNTRSLTWTPSGPNPFNLSYHWYRANTVPPGTAPAGAVVWDGPRFLVPQTVGMNQSVTITARVTAPPTPGTYVLKWDMAHEGVAWFSGKGVPTGDQTVAVK